MIMAKVLMGRTEIDDVVIPYLRKVGIDPGLVSGYSIERSFDGSASLTLKIPMLYSSDPESDNKE